MFLKGSINERNTTYHYWHSCRRLGCEGQYYPWAAKTSHSARPARRVDSVHLSIWRSWLIDLRRCKAILVIPNNFPDSARAQCCWALANSYSSAAVQLLQNPSAQVFVPTLFLLGHALELHFKAFLASQGMPDKQLRSRDIGHNLTACLRKCKERGLS